MACNGPRPTLSASRLLPGLLALSLTACEQHNAPPGFTPAEATVQRIEPQTLPQTWDFIGQTQSSRLVEIRTRVEGFLERRVYQEGSLVQAGQTLYLLDAKPFTAALQAQKGQLAQQQAIQANAKRNLARLKNLVEQKAVSQKDVDDAMSALAEADAAVLSARAQVTTAELNLSYATIQSPLTGLSSRSRKDEGSLLTPGSEGLLTTVAQMDPMWVNFNVSENQLLRIRRAVQKGELQTPGKAGYVVELTLGDGSAYPKTGRINFTDTLLASQTGTADIRAEFPNPDFLLSPGQFVRVKLTGAVRPNAISLPQRAVQQGQQGKYVYVVGKDNKAALREVQVGDWYGEDWLIESGLQAGELVVVDGMSHVVPGMPVNPHEQPASPKP